MKFGQKWRNAKEKTGPGAKIALASILVLCVAAAGFAFVSPYFHSAPTGPLAMLRGFAPGAKVSYQITPSQGPVFSGEGVVDAKGDMSVPWFSPGDGKAVSSVAFGFSVRAAGRLDPINVTMNFDAANRKTSILGDGFDDFASLQMERSGVSADTRADWAGRLQSVDRWANGARKGGGYALAMFNAKGVMRDLDNPAIIEVFSAPGGGGPPTAAGPIAGLNQFVTDDQGECSAPYGPPYLSTCSIATVTTQDNNIVNNYVLAFLMMGQQFSVNMMDQVFIIGTMLDAKEQLESQQLFQRLDAQAHKDYQPSETMCQFGSFIKSVPEVETHVAFNKQAFNAILMAQYQDMEHTDSSEGYALDIEGRIREFRQNFCDPKDNNNGLTYMCEHDQDRDLTNSTEGDAAPTGIGAPKETPPNPPGGAQHDSHRMNKDIDYARTMEFPLTLDLDFTQGPKTGDEEDVLALARNLYWPRALESAAWKDINTDFRTYMDARKIFAFTNVAHNSFIQVAAMKAHSDDHNLTETTNPADDAMGWNFMKSMMRNFGLSDDDINGLLGNYPSYWAQMEVLTKKIYQQPDFYTNLMDTPTNVARIGDTLDAIDVMQQRDMLESLQRREMLDSLMIEEELNTHSKELSGRMAAAVKEMKAN